MTTTGATVIVSGSSSGLGSKIVESLLNDSYRVIGVARRDNSDEIISANRGNYSHITFDLSVIESIHNLVQMIKERTDGIYGLVNNAAVGIDGILPTMHNSDIEYLIRLNLTSPIVLTKYIGREMLASRNGGRIVNITSIVANSGYKGLSVYGATKSGLEGFTRSLSRELGTRQITVNSIAPGFMDTDMTTSLDDANMQKIRNRAALKRFPTLEEVASAVNYLMSPNASGITGSCMTIDAGNTA